MNLNSFERKLKEKEQKIVDRYHKTSITDIVKAQMKMKAIQERLKRGES